MFLLVTAKNGVGTSSRLRALYACDDSYATLEGASSRPNRLLPSLLRDFRRVAVSTGTVLLLTAKHRAIQMVPL